MLYFGDNSNTLCHNFLLEINRFQANVPFLSTLKTVKSFKASRMKTVKVRNGDNNILPNSLNHIPNSLNYTILFPTHSLESFDFSSTYSYACVFLTIFVG